MKLSLQARLLLAVSQSAKKEIIRLYQSKPNFPKSEEEQQALFNKLDTLMPPGIPEGKAKVYTIYLAKQLYGITPPGWVLDEDEQRVTDTLEALELAIKEHRLQGNEANIDSYATLSDVLTAATKEKKKEKEHGINIDDLPEKAESTKGGQPGNPRKAVAEGATVVAQVGAWKVYRLDRGDPKGKEALSWLAMNGWWGGRWCVGRDYSGDAWRGRPYQNQGNFYIFARNGKTEWPMSTDGRSATLWSKADDPIWNSQISHGGGSFPNLEKTAKSMGLTLSFGEVSTLPNELVPILKAAIEVDSYLAQLIPESQLVEVPATDLDAIIAKTPAEELVQDLNQNTGGRAVGAIQAILGRCVSKTNPNGIKSFKGQWDKFSESTMIKYIEALASAGWTALPPSLEEYFVQEAENFEF